MSRDASPEPVLTNADLADGLCTNLDALVVALGRADLSRATPPELRRLVAVMDEVEEAIALLVAAVEAANAPG
jgi:hypothetical protein